jgi:hypothetical protein
MLKIATIEEVENYYNSTAISQSFLKSLTGDLDKLLEEKSSSGFRGGKLVDTMLLSHPEDFDRIYYVSNTEKLPSEAMQIMIQKLVKILFDDYLEQINVVSTSLSEPTTEGHQDELFPELEGSNFINYAKDMTLFSHYILAICQESEWNSRWGNDAKINAFLKEEEYYKDIVASQGKIVISKTEHEDALRFCKSLREHPRTARFFDKEIFNFANELEVYYQLPVYFNYRGKNCKALLDIVIVEYENFEETRVLKRIIPVDLKSTGLNTYYFPQQLANYRYDIQAAWYTLALAKYFQLPEDTTLIEPFMFVVNSFSNPSKPATFVLNRNTLRAGKEGFSIGSKEYKGYEALLEMYDYYSSVGFKEEREFVEAGNLPIEITFNGYVKKD